MNWSAFLAVGTGAVVGAWLRYGLGLWLNPSFAKVPLGTLVANLSGGYLVGVAIVIFHAHADLPPEWRLFVVTGLLGALTTFSTFSAEIIQLLQNARFAWAAGAIVLHLGGSLIMTALGIFSTYKLMQLMQ